MKKILLGLVAVMFLAGCATTAGSARTEKSPIPIWTSEKIEGYRDAAVYAMPVQWVSRVSAVSPEREIIVRDAAEAMKMFSEGLSGHLAKNNLRLSNEFQFVENIQNANDIPGFDAAGLSEVKKAYSEFFEQTKRMTGKRRDSIKHGDHKVGLGGPVLKTALEGNGLVFFLAGESYIRQPSFRDPPPPSTFHLPARNVHDLAGFAGVVVGEALFGSSHKSYPDSMKFHMALLDAHTGEVVFNIDFVAIDATFTNSEEVERALKIAFYPLIRLTDQKDKTSEFF